MFCVTIHPIVFQDFVETLCFVNTKEETRHILLEGFSSNNQCYNKNKDTRVGAREQTPNTFRCVLRWLLNNLYLIKIERQPSCEILDTDKISFSLFQMYIEDSRHLHYFERYKRYNHSSFELRQNKRETICLMKLLTLSFHYVHYLSIN